MKFDCEAMGLGLGELGQNGRTKPYRDNFHGIETHFLS
jgi:hypothetical protein